jgi:protein-tyrosine-phosphatase
MPHLLVMCTANICRSPMADGLARAHLAAAGHPDWEVSSAGTWALDGRAGSEFSLRLLAERGIDLSGHRSRAVSREILSKADLVLVMTRDHKEALQVEYPDQAKKVYLLSEMAGPAFDIGDPIGGPIEEYRHTFAEIDDLLARGLPRIIELMSQE